MSKLSIGKQLQKKMDEDEAYSWYKYFEPWDVEERDSDIYRIAEKDGVNLFHDDYIRTGNVGKHPFQTGYLLSTKRKRGTIGPTQGGKSVPALIEIGCMCSGEFPIALQYDKGVDSGVERLISNLNISRWGRFDKITGKFIDHDQDAPRDGTWNCGNIIGVGKYPKEKVIPKVILEEKVERVIWIGTTKRALLESWWPRLTEEGRRMFPEKFINQTKGNGGTNQSDGNYVVHLTNNIRLSIISYDSGFKKFESITAWACFFDEESADERCQSAALTHCKYFAQQMTPYNGLTYTKDYFFPKDYDAEKDIFHATAYDSPYISDADIASWRSDFPEHEIGARIWGEHTAESNMPYYNAKKLRSWVRQMDEGQPLGFRARFMPSEEYYGIKKVRGGTLPGLMDVESKIEEVSEEGAKDDVGHNMAWTIYEELRSDAAYFIISDAANGADLPEDAGDYQSAVVMRKKDPGEDPVMVAEIETTVTPDRFAQVIGLALRYYNNALLCAEAPSRGAANGMFFSEMREYPYWFVRSVQKQSTNKYLTQQGFDTNVGTRKNFFDEIEKIFGKYTKDELPPIPSKTVFRMAFECTKVIKNGTIRPDHPRNKPNDMLVCFGIGLWIHKVYPEQIRLRIKKKETLAKAPKDSVIGLLTAKRAAEQKPDPHFPSSMGSRR